MVEVVFGLPDWLVNIVLPVLKSSGKAAAIKLCESKLPLGKLYCKPGIDALFNLLPK